MLLWSMAESEYLTTEKASGSAESNRSQLEFSREAAASTSLKDSLEMRNHTHL